MMLQLEYDPLTQPAQAEHPLPCCFAEGRIYRPQDERIAHDNALERLVHHSRGELFEVERDVGKLGHLEASGAGDPHFAT